MEIVIYYDHTSNHLLITILMRYVEFNQRSLKKNIAQKSNQKTNAGIELQTQIHSFTMNPNENITETTEII